MSHTLIQKYNVPGPRYTSYPTVPFWKNTTLTELEWLDTIHLNYNTFGSNEISVYIHLPFCESLCTFCGCHKRITKNHAVESPYIDTVIAEWRLYLSKLDFIPVIRELHLGGGTPTFFSPSELKRLISSLVSMASVHPSAFEFSFEAHPNNTSDEHLEVLFGLGFKRLSLGIQDYSPTVQQAIHRLQPFDTVAKVHAKAKEVGYTSISHDLVFGLPKQTLSDIRDTVSKTLLLLPDRISLYSYAHVPWVKGVGQRGYDENDLPQDSEKRVLYEVAKSLLEEAGYLEVGMDHFALPHDSLAIAMKNNTLHRNFMGYTTQNTSMLLGLGMSSISDSWFGFAQNEKTVEEYQERVNRGELPVFRGHILSPEELLIRRHILDLMCHFETVVNDKTFLEEVKVRLRAMEADGLVVFDGNKLLITEAGIPFVRNACMAFDKDLQGGEKREGMFSKTV
jgi:oxygen-independent coproporphyrinogen-3 oxidase